MKNCKKNGDEFFVYYENSKPAGCFIAGKSAAEAEDFLLRNTNTAQIKSAFVKPSIRGKGIGGALLQQAVKWEKEKGFIRFWSTC